jgi:hypothetical protein
MSRLILPPGHLHPGTAQHRAPAEEGGGGSMAALASAFLDTLEPDQRAQAVWPFADAERRNWHFVPRERAGVPLRAISDRARSAFDRLLRAALSDMGYARAKTIMALETVLGEIEQHRRHRRDPLNYSVTVFGRPGEHPWAWRLEGHHVSLNLTSVTADEMAVTPNFWGANPAKVPEGYEGAGERALGDLTDLAFELIQSLEPAARDAVMLQATSLGNIVTQPGREAMLQSPEGLALSELGDGRQNLALQLIQRFVQALAPAEAERQWQRIREAGLERIHLAWAGVIEDGGAYYWRLHGPVTLVEYDNTQNDANHIHTVWQDLTRNFGEDLLRRHYAEGCHHHHH